MRKTLLERVTGSAEETEALGRSLAETIAPTLESERFALVALSGGLGAGKTAFTRGLVSFFSDGSYVRSPSYTIVNRYKGSLPSTRKLGILHFDIWRLKTEDDLYSAGYFDSFPYGDETLKPEAATLMAVEWCDSVPGALPDSYWRVDIDGSGAGDRRITVSFEDGE